MEVRLLQSWHFDEARLCARGCGMPRRLITQPPLLPEAGWESQQVLRVRVWTHVTQNVHGARQPSVFLPLGMGRLGLGKRLCVFAVVCVVEPT